MSQIHGSMLTPQLVSSALDLPHESGELRPTHVQLERKHRRSSSSLQNNSTKRIRGEESTEAVNSRQIDTQIICPEPGCGQNFTRKTTLRRHLRTVHRDQRGELPYVCDYEKCGSSFDRKDKLDRHRKGHTKEDFEICLGCGASFRKDAIDSHLQALRNAECLSTYSNLEAAKRQSFQAGEDIYESLSMAYETIEDLYHEAEGQSALHSDQALRSEPSQSDYNCAQQTGNADFSETTQEDATVEATGQTDLPVTEPQGLQSIFIENRTANSGGVSNGGSEDLGPGDEVADPVLFSDYDDDDHAILIDRLAEAKVMFQWQSSKLTNGPSSISKRVRRLRSKERNAIDDRLSSQTCQICHSEAFTDSASILIHVKQHLMVVSGELVPEQIGTEGRSRCDRCDLSFFFKEDLDAHSWPIVGESVCDQVLRLREVVITDWVSKSLLESLMTEHQAWNKALKLQYLYNLVDTAREYEEGDAKTIVSLPDRLSKASLQGNIDTFWSIPSYILLDERQKATSADLADAISQLELDSPATGRLLKEGLANDTNHNIVLLKARGSGFGSLENNSVFFHGPPRSWTPYITRWRDQTAYQDTYHCSLSLEERTISLKILDSTEHGDSTWEGEDQTGSQIATKEAMYKCGDAFVLFFSLSDKTSLLNIRDQWKHIIQTKRSADYPVMITAYSLQAGEWLDVSRADIEETLDWIGGARFFEIDPYHEDSLNRAFTYLCKELTDPKLRLRSAHWDEMPRLAARSKAGKPSRALWNRMRRPRLGRLIEATA